MTKNNIQFIFIFQLNIETIVVYIEKYQIFHEINDTILLT